MEWWGKRSQGGKVSGVRTLEVDSQSMQEMCEVGSCWIDS